MLKYKLIYKIRIGKKKGIQVNKIIWYIDIFIYTNNDYTDKLVYSQNILIR